MKIINSYSKLSKEEMEAKFEQRGIKVPNDYLEFLTHINGGEPEVKCDYVDKDDPEFEFNVDSLYGISSGQGDLDVFSMWGLLSDVIPDSLLAIGQDGIGNKICIGIKGETFGKVYFWNKDNEDLYKDKNSLESVIQVTESFEEFFSGLQESEY